MDADSGTLIGSVVNGRLSADGRVRLSRSAADQKENQRRRQLSKGWRLPSTTARSPPTANNADVHSGNESIPHRRSQCRTAAQEGAVASGRSPKLESFVLAPFPDCFLGGPMDESDRIAAARSAGAELNEAVQSVLQNDPSQSSWTGDLAPGQRRLRIPSPLPASCGSADALEQRMSLHRQPCPLLPTRAASSLESTCRWMVAQRPDNRRSALFRRTSEIAHPSEPASVLLRMSRAAPVAKAGNNAY
jgi:hypothetical protein